MTLKKVSASLSTASRLSSASAASTCGRSVDFQFAQGRCPTTLRHLEDLAKVPEAVSGKFFRKQLDRSGVSAETRRAPVRCWSISVPNPDVAAAAERSSRRHLPRNRFEQV